ncbi:MAG: DUF6089 family protein [Bacteroidia bacterium]
MRKIVRKYCILLGLLLLANWGSAQRKMPVVVLNDTTLASGTYVADNNILISKNATLMLGAGSKIVLGPNVVMRIEGGLKMSGSEMVFAEITSADNENKALGLVVSEISSKSIELNKVRITNLEMPLEFDAEWYRPLVKINKCEFKENESYIPGVFVRVPDNIEVAEDCNFYFTNNSYIDNTGGIYFENIDQLNFKINFTNNFIFGNKSYGAGFEGMLTSPLFFRCDSDNELENFEMSQNLLMNNFIFDSEFDTVIKEVNLGSAGNASRVALTQNYFGKGSIDQKTKKIDHFSNNGDAPFIQIAPDLKKVPEAMPPFVGDVVFNGKAIGNKPKFIIEPTSSFEMQFSFNEEVDIANSEPQLLYVGLDSTTEEEVKGQLEAKIEWVNGKTAIVKSADAALGKLKLLFITFRGVVAKSQFSVPTFTLGENGYRKYMAVNYADGIKNLKRYETNRGNGPGGDQGNEAIDPALLEEIIAKQDSLEELLDKMKLSEDKTYEDIIEQAERQIIFAKFYKGSFEVGPYIGSSIYFGDFTGNDIFDPSDASLSLGIVGKYNFNERLTVSGNFIYGKLQGTETDAFRGSGYPDRGFEFTSPLFELSSSIELNLNKLGFGDQGRFTPALSVGIGYFYFNPMGFSDYLYANGFTRSESMISLYDYRTAGLPLDQNYSKTSLCIPFGVHIKSIVKNKLLLDFSFTWRATFTDMIDDFGEPGVYQEYEYFEQAFANDPYVNGTSIKKADVAFDYHNSLTPENYYKPGSNRFGSFNDWYIITGVTISYIKSRDKK